VRGIGTRNFEEYSGVWQEVHMTYLQITVEGGIPALVIFLIFFAYGFKNVRKIMRRKNLSAELKLFTGALQSLLFAFAVGALFAPEAYQFFPYFAVAYTSALLACVRDQDRIKSAALKPVANQLNRPVPAYANVGVPANT